MENIATPELSGTALPPLLNALPQLAWAASPDGTPFFKNGQAALYASLSGHNAWHWLQLVHPTERAEESCAWQQAVQSGTPFRRQHRLLMANGHYHWHLTQASPQKDASGGVLQWVGTATDIQEQKEAGQATEERLQQLSRHLQLSTSAAKAGTWEVNLATQSLEWSALHKLLWGYPENFNAVTPALWRSAIVAEDVDRVVRHFKKAEQDYLPVDISYRISRVNDGSIRWVRSIGNYTFDEKGAPATFSGICLDITEQKKTEEAIRESEEKYRGLFETMDQGFCIVEVIFDAASKPVDYRFVECNPMFGKQTGLVNAVGKTARELVPRLEQHWFDLYGQVVLSGEATRFINRSRAMKRWFDVYAFRIGGAGSQRVAILFTDITERKNVEEAMRKLTLEQTETLATLESMLKNAPVGFAFFDKAHRYLRINETLAGINGLSVEDHLGRSIEELLPENAKSVVPVLDQVFETKAPVLNLEIKGETPREPGVTRHWLTGFYPVLNEQTGAVNSVGAVVLEITDRILAEEKTRESESRFRILAETLPQMVWMMDAAQKMEYTSRGWYDYSGFSDVVTAWWAMVHPDDMEPLMQAWSTQAAQGRSFRNEVRLKNKAGEYRWHYSVAEPVRDEGGKVIKWIGALTDIHVQKTFAEKLEKKVAERTAELQKATLQLKSLNSYLLLQNQTFTHAEEASGQGSYSWNLHSGLLSYSDHMYRLLGYEPGAFEPSVEQFLSLAHPADRGRLTAISQEAWQTGQGHDGGYRIVRPDGAVRHVHITGRVLTADGEPVMIGTVRDVTEDVLLRQKLEANNLELERSNADLQQFAHVASHDLKEPVRKIRFFGSCLTSEFGHLLPEKANQYLQKMESAAGRMYSMVEGVLQYSALSQESSHAEAVDLSAVLRSIETDLELMIRDKGARLQYGVLPLVHGYPVLMHQLFYNLINNALKFSKPGVPPEIRITAQEQPGAPNEKKWAVITLQDNGIGFAQQHAEQIFKTFARLNPKDEFEGTGLGLALCKKIVERHGGTISANGVDGEGATFTLVLPVE